MLWWIITRLFTADGTRVKLTVLIHTSSMEPRFISCWGVTLLFVSYHYINNIVTTTSFYKHDAKHLLDFQSTNKSLQYTIINTNIITTITYTTIVVSAVQVIGNHIPLQLVLINLLLYFSTLSASFFFSDVDNIYLKCWYPKNQTS